MTLSKFMAIVMLAAIVISVCMDGIDLLSCWKEPQHAATLVRLFQRFDEQVSLRSPCDFQMKEVMKRIKAASCI